MIRLNLWSSNYSARRRKTHGGVRDSVPAPATPSPQPTVPPGETTPPVPTTSSAPSAGGGRRPSSTEELFAPAFASRFPPAAVVAPAASPALRPSPAAPSAGPLPAPGSGWPRRRAEVRKPLHLAIELLHRDRNGPEFAIGADLSPSGAYVLAEQVLAPRDRVLLRFRLPWTDDHYAFLGEVVRVQPPLEDETDVLYGYGVRFLDVQPNESEHLRDELHDLPPVVDWSPGLAN